MDKAYVAAPIFTAEQLAVVRDIVVMLKMLEWQYFSPYENSQGIWKGRAPKDCSQEERDQVLTDNIENLDWAELLICWVGGMDDPNYQAESALATAVRHLLDEHPSRVPGFHLEELHRALSVVANSKPAPTDTGVTWEMGHFNALTKKMVGAMAGYNHPRFTLAYIHPTDQRQSMNLMLAGTVDAVTMGPAQLHKALTILRNPIARPTGAPDPRDVVREQFHPDKLIAHEKEPIV